MSTIDNSQRKRGLSWGWWILIAVLVIFVVIPMIYVSSQTLVPRREGVIGQIASHAILPL